MHIYLFQLFKWWFFPRFRVFPFNLLRLLQKFRLFLHLPLFFLLLLLFLLQLLFFQFLLFFLLTAKFLLSSDFITFIFLFFFFPSVFGCRLLFRFRTFSWCWVSGRWFSSTFAPNWLFGLSCYHSYWSYTLTFFWWCFLRLLS